MNKKIGIAGLGAIGSTVAHAIEAGIEGLTLHAVSDPHLSDEFSHLPNFSFKDLAKECDLIIEALPPDLVLPLSQEVFKAGKDMIIISACAILINPEILEHQKAKKSRILVPSGALIGIDGVTAMAQIGIKEARIASTKRPEGFKGAPYIIANNIDLSAIDTKTRLFEGNALEAAKAFPSNVNVAATLSLAGIGPEKTRVEIWADPNAKGNAHEISVEGEFSKMSSHVENTPAPANPKSSMLAAQSIIATLKNMNAALVIL